MENSQEPLFVVQCTRGFPEFNGFVDCSEPCRRYLAEQRAQALKEPKNWMGGKAGKIRILPAEESNCYGAYKAQGLVT